MDRNEILAAQYLGMTTDQISELKNCLEMVRNTKNGFGNIKIAVKRQQVYNFTYTVETKPSFLKKFESHKVDEIEKF